ncbi:MAG: 16S rRNA (cytosine(967)-C(5))-methyltransferase RsmB [Rubricoccaceae bacterium]
MTARRRPETARETPPPPRSARALAVQRLLRVEEDGAFVARLGARASGPDSRRERNAQRGATDLVAGVTRLRRRLDHAIAHFARREAAALDAPVRQVLRLGLFELFVRGVPPHAAVDEAVGLARGLAGKGAAGFVNAVLRAALRAGALPEPRTGDPAEDLAVGHSYPTWLVRRWLARFGPDETEALLRAGNAPPRFGLRVDTRRAAPGALAAEIAALGVDVRPSAWLDDFLVADRLQPVLRGGFVADGRCAVQDEAAGLVVRVLDPQPGEAVLDGAAAPGGKALYAMQRMGGQGRLVALDVSEAKTALVARAAAAAGFDALEARAADLRTATLDGPFDRVLLDAPCSGTGVLAKRADLRWRRTEEDLARLTALQDDLLEAAARHVRPGGLLVYATCSVEPEENAARVAAFLARTPGFRPEPVAGRVPAPFVGADGHYHALPHRHGTDGAFAARLRREA